jgi:hypothetical protein
MGMIHSQAPPALGGFGLPPPVSKPGAQGWSRTLLPRNPEYIGHIGPLKFGGNLGFR